MKFWEAMKALEEGKKVRMKCWLPQDYIDNSSVGGNIDHLSIPWPNVRKAEWELYEEPVQTFSFAEVVKGLKEGKRFKRLNKSWPSECYLKLVRKDLDIIENVNELEIKDFEATDWIEVK